MSRAGKIKHIARVFAVWILLSSNIEAAEIPQYNGNSLERQTKNSLNIFNDREKKADNLDNLSSELIDTRLLSQVNNVKQFTDVGVTDWSTDIVGTGN